MEARRSKKEQMQIFERRFAKKRQSLEEKQRRLEEKQRRLEEKQRQLEEEQSQLGQEWQRFQQDYELGQKFIDELWAEGGDEIENGEPEPQLGEIQQERSPSPNGTNRRSVSEEVMLIVDEWQDDLTITQSEVTQKFLEKHPDRKSSSLVSLISHTLSQSANDEGGVLELVEKGAGSRPAKYRKRTKQEKVESLGP